MTVTLPSPRLVRAAAAVAAVLLLAGCGRGVADNLSTAQTICINSGSPVDECLRD